MSATAPIHQSTLITIEEFAEITGCNLNILRNNRIKMGLPEPVIPNSKSFGSGNNPSYYSRREMLEWLDNNDIKKAMYEATTGRNWEMRQFRLRTTSAPQTTKAEKNGVYLNSLRQQFIMGKFDPVEIQHERERRLDQARIRCPKTVKVAPNPEYFI